VYHADVKQGRQVLQVAVECVHCLRQLGNKWYRRRLNRALQPKQTSSASSRGVFVVCFFGLIWYCLVEHPEAAGVCRLCAPGRCEPRQTSSASSCEGFVVCFFGSDQIDCQVEQS
jgi:hypothetical protein